MLICHCKRVSDRVIRAAVREGAGCHETVGSVCGTGTGCGGCVPMVQRLIREESSERPSLHSLPVLSIA